MIWNQHSFPSHSKPVLIHSKDNDFYSVARFVINDNWMYWESLDGVAHLEHAGNIEWAEILND